MSDALVRSRLARRLGGAEYGKNPAIYKFEMIKRAKTAARAAHPAVELLDFGVGEPDEMAFPEVVRTLQEQAARPENRGYADNGIGEFRAAAARSMAEVYGVSGLNPDTEVMHSIGSKAALALLPLCFIDPGDVVLMTTPGYPVFGTHARYLGGRVVNLPLRAANDFLPDLDRVAPADLERAKVLVINYPNNPTGGTATPEFFETVVRFAHDHSIVVVHDAAYAALVFDGRPLSILTTPGAREVAVELHSMSKAFNMTGWRLGWVCGNELAVRAYADVKDNSDSGQFIPIQRAAAVALAHPEISRGIAAKYGRRMNALVETLAAAGFPVRAPRGSFFLYGRAPRGIKGGRRFGSAAEFSDWLIREHLVSTVPWDEVGPHVRWSVTFAARGATPEERLADERRVLAELGRRLQAEPLDFEGSV